MKSDYPIKAIPFNQVNLNDDFWSYRIKINHKITIPHVFERCEKTKRIDNFSKAAGLINKSKPSKYPFDDSDVYKIIEGAAYDLSINTSSELEKYIDTIVDKISLAQEKDGYLYTHRTINPDNPPFIAGRKRWEIVTIFSHELYNVGHLYESAVAYYEATGKQKLLDVAIKNAELVISTFGPGKNESPPGHQEIEIGLVKLYRITEDERYLNLAKFFLDIRGDKKRIGYEDYVELSKLNFPWHGEKRFQYNQTHAKVTKQNEAIGHAVRATYMYSAMTDIVALTNNNEYITALEKIWTNIISKKIYITGGVGNEPVGEAFGQNYELPNLNGYNETCASIGNILWNHRLFLLFGESKYIDILERTLYNGLISGYSLEGNRFFYTNPLASDGNLERKKWFSCACCPTNIARFIPTISGYIYAQKNSTIFINLYISSTVSLPINTEEIIITQETSYPWSGKIKILIKTSKKTDFTIALRVPGWAKNKPLPSDLYRYLNVYNNQINLKINGAPIDIISEKGYIRIKRIWKTGDIIELDLLMPIRRVLAHENVKDNLLKVAIERGPIVYCVESSDNNVEYVANLFIDDNADLKLEFDKNMLNGIMKITGKIHYLKRMNNGKKFNKVDHNLVAIPYYAWAHRGKSKMTVWMFRELPSLN